MTELEGAFAHVGHELILMIAEDDKNDTAVGEIMEALSSSDGATISFSGEIAVQRARSATKDIPTKSAPEQSATHPSHADSESKNDEADDWEEEKRDKITLHLSRPKSGPKAGLPPKEAKPKGTKKKKDKRWITSTTTRKDIMPKTMAEAVIVENPIPEGSKVLADSMWAGGSGPRPWRHEKRARS